MKWNYPSNYTQSVTKWESIIKLLERGLIPEIKGLCGFCADTRNELWYREFGLDPACTQCPLYPKYCCSYLGDHPHSVFWKCKWKIDARNFKLALRYARQMLNMIKSCAPEEKST